MTTLFLSYARQDDEPFVKRLYEDLIAQGYQIWWDRASMPNRGLTFLQDIRDAIAGVDRLLLVFGPNALQSDYVRAEWEYALSICTPVLPVLRLGDYSLLPNELKLLDAPDFRDDSCYADRLAYLLRQLKDPVAPLGRLGGDMPQLPRHFQPRPSNLAALKGTLLADVGKPVVISAPARKVGMHGMGGIGKTVLATAVAHDCDIRRAFPDGIVWITLGQTPNLTARQSDVCQTFGMPPQAFADVQVGKTNLREVLADKACLLILDDVWDTEHAQAFDVLAARSSLLVTTRDARLITALGAVEHALNVLSEEEALLLIGRWLLPPDDTPDFDEPERIVATKAALPAEARWVAEECGYLPLALALSAAQVRDGTLWEDLLAALRDADLAFLNHPHGSVMKSLKVSLDALQREDETAAQHYRELAVFPEDTTIPESAVLTLWLHTNGLREGSARQLVASLGRRALYRVEGQPPNRWVKLHDLQHDYLRAGTKDLPGLHNALIAAYRQKCGGAWHRGPNDGYFFQYLAYHLREAGHTDELQALLLHSPDWMQTKFAACTGDTSYQADLALALSDFDDPLAEPLTCLQLHAARHTIRARVDLYTDTNLQTLVWLGRGDEALAHARLRPNSEARFAGLLAVCEALAEKCDSALVDELITAANAITSERSRGDALEKTIRVLLDRHRFDDALRWARVRAENWEYYPLGEVAGALAAAERFDEAVAVAQSIESNDKRAWALEEVAVKLAAVGRVVEAVTLAHDLPDSWRVSPTLREIVIGLISAGRLGDTLAVAREMETITAFRARALTAIAVASQDSAFLDEALAAIDLVREDLRDRGRYEMVNVMVKAGWWERALAVTQTVAAAPMRQSCYQEIVIALYEAGDARADGLYREALPISRQTSKDVLLNRARALALAKWWARNGEAAKAIESAQAIDYSQEKEAALREVMRLFAQQGQVDAVRLVVDVIEATRTRDEYLEAAALILSSGGQSDDALALIHEIEDSSRRGDALQKVAAALAKAGDRRASAVLEEALAVGLAVHAYGVSEALHRITGLLLAAGRPDVAAKLCAHIQDEHLSNKARVATVAALTDAGQFDKALAVTRTLQHPKAGGESLATVAAGLAKAGDERAAVIFEEARAVAETGGEWDKPEALKCLAVTLAGIGWFDQAQAVAATIGHNNYRAYAQRIIAQALVAAGDSRANKAFDDAWESSRHSDYGNPQPCSLAELGAVLMALGDPRTDAVFKDAVSHSYVEARNTHAGNLLAVAEIAARCGHNGADEIFAKAFEIIERLDTTKSDLLCRAAGALAHAGRLEQALATARSLEKYTSSEALIAIASTLITTSPAHARNILEEALDQLLTQNYEFSQRRVCEIAALMAQLDGERTDQILAQVHSMSGAITSLKDRLSILRRLAACYAARGHLSHALTVLEPANEAEFVKELVAWVENYPQDFALSAITEVTRILGWLKPIWQDVYRAVAASNDSLLSTHRYTNSQKDPRIFVSS